jgi:hypothetical protein
MTLKERFTPLGSAVFPLIMGMPERQGVRNFRYLIAAAIILNVKAKTRRRRKK